MHTLIINRKIWNTFRPSLCIFLYAEHFSRVAASLIFFCICRFLTLALIGWVQMEQRYYENVHSFIHRCLEFLLQNVYFLLISLYVLWLYIIMWFLLRFRLAIVSCRVRSYVLQTYYFTSWFSQSFMIFFIFLFLDSFSYCILFVYVNFALCSFSYLKIDSFSIFRQFFLLYI